MVWAVLAKFITKRPPWVQAVIFGLCAGLFVAAGAEASQRDTLISTTALIVAVVGVVVGGAFYLSLQAQLRHGWTLGTTMPTWVNAAYASAWVLSLLAAILALFGAGGFKVAALAIVPIVLLAPPALIGIRILTGHHPTMPRPDADESKPEAKPS